MHAAHAGGQHMQLDRRRVDHNVLMCPIGKMNRGLDVTNTSHMLCAILMFLVKVGYLVKMLVAIARNCSTNCNNGKDFGGQFQLFLIINYKCIFIKIEQKMHTIQCYVQV